ncbi:hypothetical protein FO519_009651 [Halicephalobus sp. NKZ332]|nr:hypothetical protein FO519_009651 [Halicephalobus sp. NKZ332]
MEGQRTSTIWDEFECIRKHLYECKYCRKSIKAKHTSNLIRHSKSCPKTHPQAEAEDRSSNSVFEPETKRARLESELRCISNVDESANQKANWARVLARPDVPIKFFETPEFIKFISEYKKEFEYPGRKILYFNDYIEKGMASIISDIAYQLYTQDIITYNQWSQLSKEFEELTRIDKGSTISESFALLMDIKGKIQKKFMEADPVGINPPRELEPLQRMALTILSIPTSSELAESITSAMKAMSENRWIDNDDEDKLMSSDVVNDRIIISQNKFIFESAKRARLEPELQCISNADE